MKFTNALRALLLLRFFQQAETQNAVTVTIQEESGPNVVMQWSGLLAAFPSTGPDSYTVSTSFFRSKSWTYVTGAVTDVDCKYRSDFVVSYTSHIALPTAASVVHTITCAFPLGYSGNVDTSSFQLLTTSPMGFAADSSTGTSLS